MSPHHRQQRRRGVALIYCGVALATLLGLASLAVEVGRVQCARTEMQRAATAAARAAVVELGNSLAAVQAAAVQYGAANTVDGTPLAVDAAADVEVGTWDENTRAFTPGSFAGANAVRVTARRTAARGNPIRLMLARAVGKETFDLTASAVAVADQTADQPRPGFVGLNSYTMKDVTATDSFDSRNGGYALFGSRSRGSVGSNGAMSIENFTWIRGDVYYGTAAAPGTGLHTGSKVKLTQPLAAQVATLPVFYTNHGTNKTVVAGQTLTLGSGNHYMGALTVQNSGRLVAAATTGPVKVYVAGSVYLSSGAEVVTAMNKPGNLEIHVLSTGTVTVDMDDPLYAVINAPLSNVTYTSGQLFGTVISKNLLVNSVTVLHYDEALENWAADAGGTGGTVTRGKVKSVK